MAKKNPEISTNKVFELLRDSDKRITVMQGGSRSGKTYNILIWFIAELLKSRGETLSIVRASLPSIKGSVMRDFVDILTKLNLYKDANFNKTESVYMLPGNNMVEFVSIDQPQKIRGRKRSKLFINEANELEYDAWIQLAMRTTGKIVLDYNPSMEYHWIYDHVIGRDDADFYITTYKDNPFLDANIRAEIERLQEVDENYWRVYGLGERGQSQLTIYTHWKTCDEMPFSQKYFYGLDWGFKAPTALVRCLIRDGAMYAKELLYEPELHLDAVAARLGELGVSKRDNIWCDSASPQSIDYLRRFGYNAKKSDKKVPDGIRAVQSKPLFITKDSESMLKEIRNYKWKIKKDSNNEVPPKEEPVKMWDHTLDALRYAVVSETSKKILSWV